MKTPRTKSVMKSNKVKTSPKFHQRELFLTQNVSNSS